jgi:NarL family two-component system response regulator LiaR
MVMNTERIRVFVVDDHAIVREGLKHFLEAFDFEWVGEASNGRKAVQLCKYLKPNVVLMDLFMPTVDGIEATGLLRQECPETKVVIMTSDESCDYIIEALRAGAANYVLKGIPLNDLAQVIREANNNQFHVTHETTQLLVSVYRQHNKVEYKLTQRELEIITLLSQGWTNLEIASKLFISVSTVKNHISSIYKKMDVTSRSAAVANAVRDSIV